MLRSFEHPANWLCFFKVAFRLNFDFSIAGRAGLADSWAL
jgi:hypothetical protein